MASALGDVLPLAVAIAIFPVPVIAAVVLVGSERGRLKGGAFVVAWVTGLAAVGAVGLLLAGVVDAEDQGEPATWASALLLGLGLVLVVIALSEWRGRPRSGEEAATPRWMDAVDDFTPVKAAAAGFALSALNPKNVLLVVAAAAEIAQVGLPAGQQIGTLTVFVLVASVGVLAPLALDVALDDLSRDLLEGLRAWMERHSAAIVAVLLLVIGAKLIGDAISGFAA